MTITSEAMAAAIERARADLAPLLKEQERDERGRFAGGDNDESVSGNGSKDLASIAEKIAATSEKGNAIQAAAAGDHRMLAEEHKDLAETARVSGHPAAAEAHDKAAQAHQQASDARVKMNRSVNKWNETRSNMNYKLMTRATSAARDTNILARTASRKAAEL